MVRTHVVCLEEEEQKLKKHQPEQKHELAGKQWKAAATATSGASWLSSYESLPDEQQLAHL